MVDLTAAAERLRRGGRVVVACHVNPDGDALGAAIAIALGLRQLGIEAPVTFGTSDGGTDLPPTLGFLPGQELFCDPDSISGVDVLVTTDTGSVDRLGPAARLVAEAQDVIVVDHHASNTMFGSLHVIDHEAASTTVIVMALLDELGVTLTRDIATCLYAGLVTDTGSFRYQATSAQVHRLAARLHEAGVEHVEICRALFDTAPFAAVRVLGAAMAGAQLEGDLVWGVITAAEREAAGLALADVEGAIDLIRVAIEAEVAAVLKGVSDGEWAVSLRSRGSVDVSAVAVALGGGGHRFAAGYTAHGTVADILDALRKALCA
jgi:phosphoesterase RecJ-like protein